MVIVGGVTGREVRRSDGLCEGSQQVHTSGGAYDPRTDTWRSIAMQPGKGPAVFVVAGWDGQSIYLWGLLGAGEKLSFRRYDPETDTWAELPAPPVEPFRGMSMSWTGEELLLSGGQTFSGVVGGVSAFDPETGRWRRRSEPPHQRDEASTVWTGSEVIEVGGCCALGSNVVIYDVSQDGWTVGPALELSCDLDQCSVVTEAVFTGGGVFVWGGLVEVFSEHLDLERHASGAWLGPADQ